MLWDVFPNLALARRVATPPALLRLKPEAALQGQTNAAETNRKGAYKTLARQADEAECRALLRRRDVMNHQVCDGMITGLSVHAQTIRLTRKR